MRWKSSIENRRAAREIQMRNNILSVESQIAEHGPPAASPTHVHWYIIGLLAVVSALTYLDRLNLSIAGKYIQASGSPPRLQSSD